MYWTGPFPGFKGTQQQQQAQAVLQQLGLGFGMT